MYLEIRKVGKSKAYYLAHSFREGGKIFKIRRFLGTNLSEAQIAKLRKKAESIILQEVERYKIINNPLTRELEPREIEIIKALQDKVDLKVEHLDQKEWDLFTEAFTYDTNAIEGSTVTFGEVKDILENDDWPKDTSKDDISETYGVSNAVDEIRNTKDHISQELILRLHELCFKNSKDFAGKFRPKGVEVYVKNQLGEVLHVGAPSNRIKSLLKELVSWYDTNKDVYPTLLLAIVVHNQFEVIHPFQDGNGRVGRLLLNNILIKNGFPPVNITFKRRARYYKAIREYQNNGDLRPMIELILEEYKRFYKHT